MIDMQRTPEPKPGATLVSEPHQDEPRYPWGLEIRLEAPELAKLGISPDALPAVGTPMTLNAQVRVTMVRSEASLEGGKDITVSLQIEQMQLGSAVQQGLAERMYGGAR